MVVLAGARTPGVCTGTTAARRRTREALLLVGLAAVVATAFTGCRGATPRAPMSGRPTARGADLAAIASDGAGTMLFGVRAEAGASCRLYSYRVGKKPVEVANVRGYVADARLVPGTGVMAVVIVRGGTAHLETVLPRSRSRAVEVLSAERLRLAAGAPRGAWLAVAEMLGESDRVGVGRLSRGQVQWTWHPAANAHRMLWGGDRLYVFSVATDRSTSGVTVMDKNGQARPAPWSVPGVVWDGAANRDGRRLAVITKRQEQDRVVEALMAIDSASGAQRELLRADGARGLDACAISPSGSRIAVVSHTAGREMTLSLLDGQGRTTLQYGAERLGGTVFMADDEVAFFTQVSGRTSLRLLRPPATAAETMWELP